MTIDRQASSTDFTAGHVTSEEAAVLIAALDRATRPPRDSSSAPVSAIATC